MNMGKKSITYVHSPSHHHALRRLEKNRKLKKGMDIKQVGGTEFIE